MSSKKPLPDVIYGYRANNGEMVLDEEFMPTAHLFLHSSMVEQNKLKAKLDVINDIRSECLNLATAYKVAADDPMVDNKDEVKTKSDMLFYFAENVIQRIYNDIKNQD